MAIQSKLEALEKMFEWLWEQCILEEGGDIDSWDIQEQLEECGLIESVPYDPEKHGEITIEKGDPVFVKTALAEAAL